MAKAPKLSPSVTRHLGHYVYLYVRPDTEEVFYVGKGKGNRALAHIEGKGNTPHDEVIRELHDLGLKPRVELLIHGLKTEAEAFAVEMAAIDLIGLERLSNRVYGHNKSRLGRMSIDQVRALYDRKPVKITEPVVIIRVARRFHYGIDPVALYDATRSAWVVGERREGAEYALAVYENIVREVYRITHWLPSGSTFRADRPTRGPAEERWEFVGVVAEEKVRKKYLNRSVAKHIPKHSQNPILYVNC